MPYPSITPGLRLTSSRRGSGRRLAKGGRVLAGALAAVLLSSAVTACDSASDPDAATAGGTLRVVLPAMPSHLDPQLIAASMDANMSRLITRTLTTFRSESGVAGGELVPDLATDLGRPSEGNTVWQFRLKDGLKWEDGSAVNCSQVKYGVERNFSDLFLEGLGYARQLLVDNDTPYKGPFVGGNKNDLKSVTCDDAKTITFRLRQPLGDFNYTVALPIFAPVKQGADGDKPAYDLKPLSTGPYRVEWRVDTDPENGIGELLLVRNKHWDAATDLVRKALPDRIHFVTDTNLPAVTNALIQNQGEDRNSIMLASDVTPNFLQQVINDPELSARTAAGPMGAVRFFAVNTKLIKDVRCRQAIAYAFNKRKYRQAMGGSVIGDLATSMLPPNLLSHKDFDHYGTLTGSGDGDPDKAFELIEDAKKDGVECPKKLNVSVPEIPQLVRYVKTLIDAYVRIGVKVELVTYPPSFYWREISDSGRDIHLRYAGWIPDWPSGSAVLPALFDGRSVQPPGEFGTLNFSFLQDGEVDKALDEIRAEKNLDRQHQLWGDLDSKLQEQAVTIPVLYTNAVRIMGSNVSGGFIHASFGMPDLCALGVKDASLASTVPSPPAIPKPSAGS